MANAIGLTLHSNVETPFLIPYADLTYLYTCYGEIDSVMCDRNPRLKAR